MYLDDMQIIANSLGVELITTVADESGIVTTMLRPTGGKIIAKEIGNNYSVYGVIFEGETARDSFYWAVQFAAHCR